jgi:hypothetical protein
VSDLVAALLFVADDLDRCAYPFAGTVRQGARRIAEIEGTAPGPNACERCGGPIDQKPLGRPRRYCSERCRKRAGNATLLRSLKKESV